MIATNNHSAGFGPGTANLFRKMVGLSELSSADHQHNTCKHSYNNDNNVKRINKLENQTFLPTSTARDDKVASQNL